MEIKKEENKRSYLLKKRQLKRLKFVILRTSAIALLKGSIGITSGIFRQYLPISGYMINSIKNNVRILKGIDITTKNMTEKNFSVLITQIEEEKVYENYILEYLEDINMQMQFRNSFITYPEEQGKIKEQLKQSKQRMKYLSKAYIKK